MRGRFRTAVLGTVSAAGMLLATSAFADVTLNVQRFFGACDAEFGQNTDVSKAVGECGIMTSLINKFEADNPDIHVNVTTVEWPGYDQLTAQFASGDAPDIVTIHESVLSDYQSKGLLMPLDDLLAKEGITTDDFTQASLNGAIKDGHVYGLPLDTWTHLFHINLGLFKQAGLLNADGTPILPTSADELIAQATQFKEKTGKPYFTMPLANETALYMRDFYTYLFQQDSDFFADPLHVKFTTPEAKNVVELYKKLYQNGLMTKGLDYASSVTAFVNGDAGVHLNGTWMVGDYDAQAKTPGSALSEGGYAVYPYPKLYKTQAQYVDGHTWAVPNKDYNDETLAAIGKFLKFFKDNDYEWSRTGHMPAYKSVANSEKFQALPHRQTILKVTEIGKPLPAAVQRQFAIQDIVGEEMSAAMFGQKDVDQALQDMENRVNDLLANL